MALTDLLKSLVRASAFGLALYACGDDSVCGDSPFSGRHMLHLIPPCPYLPYLYVTDFGVEDCMAGDSHGWRDSYSGNRVGDCYYVRSFSCEEVLDHPEFCDNYRCALSENEDFYIEDCGEGINFFANYRPEIHFLLEDSLLERKFNMVDYCRSVLPTEPWYEQCFGEASP